MNPKLLPIALGCALLALATAAAEHADVVERLKKVFDETNAQPREHPSQSPARGNPKAPR